MLGYIGLELSADLVPVEARLPALKLTGPLEPPFGLGEHALILLPDVGMLLSGHRAAERHRPTWP